VGSGNPCDDSLGCTDDVCSETGGGSCTFPVTDGCLVDGLCRGTGTTNPANGCEICDPARSVSTWSPDAGASCDDGDGCTGPDSCDTYGRCTGAAIPHMHDVVQVAAGWRHTCARLAGGVIECWGYNGYGELGDGTRVDSPRPGLVSGIVAGATDVAAGTDHTCAVVAGTVMCWGRNADGQIGDGSTTDRDAPTTVPGVGAVEVCAGFYHSCARTTLGNVQCWGQNFYGQLGNATSGADELSPVWVATPTGSGRLSSVGEIACGGLTTCARTTSGAVYCWGRNSSGQLGVGDTTDRSRPAAVWSGPGDSTQLVADEIAGGGYHSCARIGSGLRCWGNNTNGQLGDGTNALSSAPVMVLVSTGTPLLPVTDAAALALGAYHGCALTTGSRVRCWGMGDSGQLGDGVSGVGHQSSVARIVFEAPSTTFTGATAVGAGAYHGCAVAFTDENLLCWGEGLNGQIGDGYTSDRLYPTRVVCHY
jgi:alpha-tubulin suppressor-like RCC1 family protein